MNERSIVVFAGPSLPTNIRPSDTAYRWRPPAAAGDLLGLLGDPPNIVCLIDGYFDARPSPWHKEILLLIQSGVRVLGAASMGALRAAELDRHGMIGIGAIYRAYRDCRLTGDDEVALVHALDEFGWKPVSEPMIDVRATLASAVRRKMLSISAARELRAAAHSIHFSERDWPAILHRAACQKEASRAFLTWLRTGTVRLKQCDALACIASAKTERLPPGDHHPVPFTCFMRDLAAECEMDLEARSIPSFEARGAPVR